MHSNTTGRWMPVALAADLPAKTVMPARIAGASIALWRSATGHLAAYADRCPHRGMRLSHGFVRGEILSCIYHGWSYARTGQCLRIPAHPGLYPPEAIRVATYAVEEHDGIVWVASGTPDQPPPRLGKLVPLRTLAVSANIKAIEGATGAAVNSDGILTPQAAPHGLCLLLSDPADDQTMVHLLVSPDFLRSQRLAASRYAETLRYDVENAVTQGPPA